MAEPEVTAREPRLVLARLRGITWDDDVNVSLLHARSTLAPATLDGRGRITYYAKISEGFPRSSPRGIVRRRVIGNAEETHDEAFTRNLRWEPTEYLRLHELGHNDIDHVEISEAEAAAFIETTTEKLTGNS
ncbi:hypothetical protein [Streptomyces olivaceiscleroticus]|uniref:hypothetical protein n=1 Tax=Streptomyces olivaceiscleroticus TaxID=68245 RepID=UPI0031F97A71